jgi:hypothetical protein
MLLSVLISLAAVVIMSGPPLAAQDTAHHDTAGKKPHSMVTTKPGKDAKTTTGTAVTNAKSGLAQAGVDTKTVTKGGADASTKSKSNLSTAFGNAKSGLSQAGIGGKKTVTTKSGGSTKPAKGTAADSSHTGKQ